MKGMKNMKENTIVRFSALSNRVIGCALEVHRELGPGLLESTYERCLSHELDEMGIEHACQLNLPVNYKGHTIDCGFRIDLIVEKSLLIELKAVERLLPIHEAQILTYLKLAKIKTELLINFNVPHLKNGIRSFVL